MLPSYPNLIHTEKELKNIELAKEYLRILYSREECCAENVRPIVDDNSQIIAPTTTFSKFTNLVDYANAHKGLVEMLKFKMESYDVVFAKENWVCLRYTASAVHDGKPYKSISATGKKAIWTAVGIFEIDDTSNKLRNYYKEVDQSVIYKQLGWEQP